MACDGVVGGVLVVVVMVVVSDHAIDEDDDEKGTLKQFNVARVHVAKVTGTDDLSKTSHECMCT